MDFLIGTIQQFREFRFNKAERAELIRIRNSEELKDFYSFILNRLNEYGISIIEKKFRCELFNESMSFNHLSCLLRRDVIEQSDINFSSGLITKLIKVFLCALRDCCISDGVVELDVKDVLARFQSTHRRFHHNLHSDQSHRDL